MTPDDTIEQLKQVHRTLSAWAFLLQGCAELHAINQAIDDIGNLRKSIWHYEQALLYREGTDNYKELLSLARACRR